MKIHLISLPLPFPIKQVNVYLIEEDELTLIDTGVKTKRSITTLKRELNKKGYTLKDIRRLIITHSHIDHYGAANIIKESSKCEVYSHEEEVKELGSLKRLGTNLSESQRYAKFFYECGVPAGLIGLMMAGNTFIDRLRDPVKVDRPLRDEDEILQNSSRIKVIHVPGHSYGLINLYLPEEKILFSGDHLLPKITPVPLIYLPNGEAKPKSLVNFLQSLDKVEKLEIDTIYPSHGPPFQDHRELLRKFKLFHQIRLRKIQKILSKGNKTPYMISKALFHNRARTETFLTISEVIGHLEILEEMGKVVSERRKGKNHYKLTIEN